MSEFSQQLIGRSGYLTDGFADIYDRFRPSPPDGVFDVLTFLAGAEHPELVVDFGCGTGLASRAWAARADAVVGVEPNPRMIQQARERTGEPGVRYVEAYAAETGLPEGEADLVTCFQAFHWMEPQPALAEAARILREGGVFAACDYDVPPLVEPERPLGDAIGQGLSFEILHHQKIDAVLVSNVVQGADVRMVESRNEARIAFEAAPKIGIVGEVLEKNLERDEAI